MFCPMLYTQLFASPWTTIAQESSVSQELKLEKHGLIQLYVL